MLSIGRAVPWQRRAHLWPPKINQLARPQWRTGSAPLRCPTLVPRSWKSHERDTRRSSRVMSSISKLETAGNLVSKARDETLSLHGHCTCPRHCGQEHRSDRHFMLTLRRKGFHIPSCEAAFAFVVPVTSQQPLSQECGRLRLFGIANADTKILELIQVLPDVSEVRTQQKPSVRPKRQANGQSLTTADKSVHRRSNLSRLGPGISALVAGKISQHLVDERVRVRVGWVARLDVVHRRRRIVRLHTTRFHDAEVDWGAYVSARIPSLLGEATTYCSTSCPFPSLPLQSTLPWRIYSHGRRTELGNRPSRRWS